MTGLSRISDSLLKMHSMMLIRVVVTYVYVAAIMCLYVFVACMCMRTDYSGTMLEFFIIFEKNALSWKLRKFC